MNHFGKFKTWLNKFDIGPFWSNNNEKTKNYLNKIYSYTNTPTDDLLKYQFDLSTPCCLPFDTLASSSNVQKYNNHFITSNNADGTTYNDDAYIYNNTNFLGYISKDNINTSQDLVKLVNVFSVPITNALNTTHTATDTMTFRFEKPTLPGTTDYYYIIGIYLYLTKGIPFDTLNNYPHYIGFSPSTNILNPSILTNDSSSGGGVPILLDSSFVKNTTYVSVI